MFPKTFFPTRFFAAEYWPKGGDNYTPTKLYEMRHHRRAGWVARRAGRVP